jgi:hypothetical protein
LKQQTYSPLQKVEIENILFPSKSWNSKHTLPFKKLKYQTYSPLLQKVEISNILSPSSKS